MLLVPRTFSVKHIISWGEKFCQNNAIMLLRHLSDTVGGVNLIYVGRLETDSSKGAFECRVWDCLQLRAVKTPDTFE